MANVFITTSKDQNQIKKIIQVLTVFIYIAKATDKKPSEISLTGIIAHGEVEPSKTV